MRRAGACALAAAALAGFSAPATFDQPPGEGGGGGVAYSASPRAKGYRCAMCHLDAPGRLRPRVGSDPPDLIQQGRYRPGASYRLSIGYQPPDGEPERGAHADGILPGQGFPNVNAFSLEIGDAAAAPAGTFSDFDRERLSISDDGAVLRGATVSTRRWQATWTAPPAGAGALTLYLQVVDGDASGGPDNDDLLLRVVPLTPSD